MKSNGLESYNTWNVALWINNDADLHRLAQKCVSQTSTLDEAAAALFSRLPAKTPDGVRYSLRTVRYAIRHYQQQ